jgi:hypothetical protein
MPRHYYAPSCVTALALLLLACGAPAERAASAPSSPGDPRPTLADAVSTPPDAPPAAPSAVLQRSTSLRVEFKLGEHSHGLGPVPDVLRHHASTLLACPYESTSGEQLWTSSNPWYSGFIVDGCGKRVTYAGCLASRDGDQCYTVTSIFSMPTTTAP